MAFASDATFAHEPMVGRGFLIALILRMGRCNLDFGAGVPEQEVVFDYEQCAEHSHLIDYGSKLLRND